jgi:hypothetical protein
MVMRPGRRMARRRTVATVAVVGGVAHHAAKKGAEAGAEQAYEQAPQEQAYEQAPPPPAAPAELDYTAELQQLAALHEQGILTDEEFEAKKKEVLGI